MVDYAPPWDSLPRDTMHSAHEMPLSQVRKSAAALAALLDENKDEQVLREACLGLCQLFGEGIQNDRIQAILEANVVPKLVALLRPSKRSVPISVQSAALQVLGNVACGDDRQTQVVIDSNALPCLRALLSSADRSIRKEVCWIVSNITESSHQVQDVLDADILPPLLKLLDNQDAACREDATWVLFNLSSNRDPNQIAYLAEKNGVRALCNLLTCSKELDVLWKGCGTVAAVALKGLRNILISGQIAAASDPNGYNKMASLVAEAHGVERIESLTTHMSLDVRTRARLLLERMFGAEPTPADLSPPLTPPTISGLSSLLSTSPPMPLAHSGCSCAYQQQQQQPHHHHHNHVGSYPAPYDSMGTANMHGTLSPSPHVNHGIGVEHSLSGHLHPDTDLVDVPGSTSGSSTDSDPEDDDSDSDLIPPPPAPCSCVLCTDPTPLAEKRPRGKGSVEETNLHRRSSSEETRLSNEIRQICDFCSGGGRLGDGRAGLAAKLGRAVRLGHPHCIAVLLSRMTWSQRAAATEAPALLHPGGGPPDGGVGSSLPAVVLAAQLGKPECLGLLLRRCQPDLDATHGKRRLTALAWAAHKGYSRCCQLLIEHGANPATRCGDGVTALHLAASGGGHTMICKLLIEHNAPVNARSAKKQTPLCLAAQKGSVKVVQLLLEHGADPNNEDEGKYTPLHLSASHGFVSCVDLLLKAGARVDATTRTGVTPLHYAVQGGHAQAVKLLITAGAKVNCNRKPLLLIAADDGNREVVQILLEARAAIDCKANIKAQLDKDMEFFDYLTPLHLASSKGHHEVVELLLRRGASVDEITTKSGWSALDFAVLNGNSECAIALLKYGASVTENCRTVGRNNWTLVQYAAHHGAKDVVRMLIQRLKEQRMNASAMNRNNSNTPIQQSIVIPNGDTPFPDSAALTSAFTSDEGSESIAPTEFPIPDGALDNQSTGGMNDQESCQHQVDGGPGVQTAANRYDPRSTDGDENGFVAGGRQNSGSTTENTQKQNVTRRRVVKEDRQSAMRARELKKREAEAAEARERLEEAIAAKSIPKLTEAIAHVSKLVLHFATSPTGETGNGNNHADHNDVNGYSSHSDSYGHGNRVPNSGGTNTGHNGNGSSSFVSAPMAIEIGLGNEVQKARKILAGLHAEEKRLREEKEREVAVTKRENTQQAVRKAIAAALEGGDPRSLSRATNRATRTILEKDDPVVLEAVKITGMISELEKWEGLMSTAIRNKDLDGLVEALPNVSKAIAELKGHGGEGAATRLFNGADLSAALDSAEKLREELIVRRESERAKEAEARNLERAAQERLKTAMDSDDIVELESALHEANSALRSKDSKLASIIESAKKVMAKWLKMERRKLRQACNTNDPAVIEKAVKAAEGFGLNALKGDIETTRGLAQKLREQADALEVLDDAIANANVAALNDVRNRLTSLGMFPEADKARVELDKLQKATRARSLLETAVEEAKKCQIPFQEAISKHSSKNQVELQVSWVWPDAQRLCDLSERARKWGQPLDSLCDAADKLAKELAELGRRMLELAMKSDDARAIAAVINGYKGSFVDVTKPELFDKSAGEEAICRAQERLAMVQAQDQASIKAESAQVKVEYALATSRRAATRRDGKNAPTLKSQGQQQNGNITGSNISPLANGNTTVDSIARSPSSLSSDYAEDEGSETDSGTTGIFPGESIATMSSNEAQKVVRRARGTSQIEDPLPLDALGDLPASSGGCSHFYLYKEGTTVCCARCGHLRNSGNPEWLARVKRRGNKQPPEGVLGSLPSIGSAPDLQSGFSGISINGSGQSLSPPALSNLDRTPQRSGRIPIGASHHYVSQGFPVTSVNGRDASRGVPTLGARSNPNTTGVNMMVQLMQHPQLPQGHFPPQGHHHSPQQQARLGQGAHSQTAQSIHGNKSGGSHHRGRSRPHMPHIATRMDAHAGGLPGMYGAGLAGGRGLGSMELGTSMPIQSGYGAAGMAGLGPGMGGGPTGSMHSYGVRGSGGLTTIDPKSGLRIPNDVGSVAQGVQSLQLGHDSSHGGGRETGGTRVVNRCGTQEEVGVSTVDLGVDFANENFGFDIDAIVDDIPPPGPSKAAGGHELSGHSSIGKMYLPSSHSQQNGYYGR